MCLIGTTLTLVLCAKYFYSIPFKLTALDESAGTGSRARYKQFTYTDTTKTVIHRNLGLVLQMAKYAVPMRGHTDKLILSRKATQGIMQSTMKLLTHPF